MSDQVPVVPADGAVVAAVDPPVVAPPAPADAGGDNNAQNANDNVVPAPQPAAQEVGVFSCPCVRFLGVFFGLGVVVLLAWFSLLCY